MQGHINIKIGIQKQIIHLKIKQECTIKQIIQYLHRQQLLHNSKNENDLVIKTIYKNREQIIQLQQAVSTIRPVDQQGTRYIKIVWKQQFSYSRRIPTNQNVFQCYSEEIFKSVCFAIFNYQSHKDKVQQMYRENKITKKGYEMFSRIGKQHELTGDQRLSNLKTQIKEKSQRIKKLQKELDAMNQIISCVRDRQRYNSTFQKLNQYLSPTSFKSIQLLKIIANKMKIKSNISSSSSNIKPHSDQILFQSQVSFESVMSINKQQEMNEKKDMNMDMNEGEINSKISSQLFKLPYFKLHQQQYVTRLEKYINQFSYRNVTNIYSVYFHSSRSEIKDKSQNQLQKQFVSCMQATNNFIFLFGINRKIFGIYSPTNCIKCQYSDMGFMFNLTDDKIFGIRSNQVLYNRKANYLHIWNNLISISMRENTIQVSDNEGRNFSQDCQSPQNFGIDLGKKIQFRGFQYLTAHFSNSQS